MGGQKDLQNLHTESEEDEAEDDEDYVVERVVKKRVTNGVVSGNKWKNSY